MAEGTRPLDKGEPLTRFLLSRSLFSRAKGRVKHNAFMPPADLRLSVFRTYDLDEPDIWDLGQRCVATVQPEKGLHGRADVLVSVVLENELQVDPDDVPPRHASITGWPESKDAQKMLALELAERASLRAR